MSKKQNFEESLKPPSLSATDVHKWKTSLSEDWATSEHLNNFPENLLQVKHIHAYTVYIYIINMVN